MGEGNSTTLENGATKRKQALISVLCKYLSINPDTLPNGHLDWPELKSICLNLVQLSGNENILGLCSEDREEICRWLVFADSFHSSTNSTLSKLKDFDEILVQRSILMGKGFRPSVADVVVLTSLYDVVIGLSAADRKSIPNVMRWLDYIQNKKDFSPVFEKVYVEKPEFRPKAGVHGITSTNIGSQLNECNDAKKDARGGSKTTAVDSSVKTGDTDSDKKKKDTGQKKGKEKENKKEKEEKKKIEEKEPNEKKEIEANVTALDIRVGVIRKAWKHPSADSLLVEEIDVGEEKVRQVVSGLAKHYGADELLNRRVLVVTNVKPGKLRDVMSAGLVLCASCQDQSVVEPLLPPEAAKIGEHVTFAGQEGKPEEVLNPKKKQLEKITLHLYTDDKGVATYKGVPFMTSVGACTSSIVNAGIK
eukprot:Gb_36309 [translate_table: standard]